MKYKIVSITDIETGEMDATAIERKRIGREVELMCPIEEGCQCIFINPDYSMTNTTTVWEILVDTEEKKVFVTKNSEYTLEKVEDQ